jgi:hypothetical protein
MLDVFSFAKKVKKSITIANLSSENRNIKNNLEKK